MYLCLLFTLRCEFGNGLNEFRVPLQVGNGFFLNFYTIDLNSAQSEHTHTQWPWHVIYVAHTPRGLAATIEKAFRKLPCTRKNFINTKGIKLKAASGS